MDDDLELEVPADHTSSYTKEEEEAFLRSVIGDDATQEVMGQQPTLNRETELKVDWENKPVNPHNKPLHPSVTEQYFTQGGKEVKPVHDEVGSLWHIEFSPGGELPSDLKGKYTSEPSAREGIVQYLAKRV